MIKRFATIYVIFQMILIFWGTITYASQSDLKSSLIYTNKKYESKYAAYLFAYFTGNNIEEEAVRYAISTNMHRNQCKFLDTKELNKK